MNIQVNLLKPAEFRSASMVSVRAYILIAAIVIPLVLVFVVGTAFMRYSDRASTLTFLEQQWADAQRNQRLAQQLGERVQAERRRYQAVSGWHTARGPWDEFLPALQAVVPDTIQLRSMQMRSSPEAVPGGELVQSFRITLTGRCEGPGAEERVEMLRHALSASAPFDQWVRSAVVTSFTEDTSEGAGPLDRVFQVEIRFSARSFDEVADR